MVPDYTRRLSADGAVLVATKGDSDMMMYCTEHEQMVRADNKGVTGPEGKQVIQFNFWCPVGSHRCRLTWVSRRLNE